MLSLLKFFRQFHSIPFSCGLTTALVHITSTPSDFSSFRFTPPSPPPPIARSRHLHFTPCPTYFTWRCQLTSKCSVSAFVLLFLASITFYELHNGTNKMFSLSTFVYSTTYVIIALPTSLWYNKYKCCIAHLHAFYGSWRLAFEFPYRISSSNSLLERALGVCYLYCCFKLHLHSYSFVNN